MEFLALLGLTTISSSTLFLFVSTHARSQRDVHAWRRLKPKRFCNFHKVKFVDVEDRPQTVRGICL